MDRIVIDDIPFNVDEKGLSQVLGIQPDSIHASEFSKIMKEARLVAKPKAAFAMATVNIAGENTIDISGVLFTSRVLRVNLDKAGIVFPFVATCGTELDRWSRNIKDMLHSFWVDTIMLIALSCALNHLGEYLKERLGESVKLSTMNPGSLNDWPLEEQANLFLLLGNCAPTIGATLTESMLIRPLKSVSGIQFVSEDSFINCSLCPRQECPLRRAVYDDSLYAANYINDCIQ